MYYLYVKTHTVTGLKYLGQTKSDPYKYNGSGVSWKQHLKENGNHVHTQVLKECNSKAELKSWGEYYSKLWNVVESNDWANRVIESGCGGWWLYGDKNPQKRPEVRAKTSEGMKRFLRENPEIREKRKQWRNNFWTPEQRLKSNFGGRGTSTVTDLSGVTKRIPKEEFDKMDRSLPVEQWEYVGSSSKEAIRRRALRTVTVICA